MLSLASKAQSHIGSLRFNDDGSTTLTNRPLFYAHSILESEGAPRTVNRTYTTSGRFIDDMLHFREEAFRTQPNAVNSEYDCHLQMAHILLLQLLKSQFVDYNFEGPFFLQLTDFHASNIFVDDDWNVVALIGLELICALPADMMDVPYWLSVDAIDQIGAQMDAFGNLHKAFLDQFRDEENNSNHEHNIQLASSIDQAWTTSSFCFYSCLTCINGMDYFFQEGMYKKFGFNPSLQDEKQFVEQLSSFWPSDSKSFVKQKLHDKAHYTENIMSECFTVLLRTA